MRSRILFFVGKIRCNVCDEILDSTLVAEHVAARSHAVRKKVSEFNEMNAQVKPSQQHDISIVGAWIRSLYCYDFLSKNSAQA
jgi:hypothetical protein